MLNTDEATSALDYTSRELCFDALRKCREGKTTIVITHDINQLRGDDFAYVFENHKVVENGYRRNLEKARHGVFASMLHAEQEGLRQASGLSHKNVFSSVWNQHAEPKSCLSNHNLSGVATGIIKEERYSVGGVSDVTSKTAFCSFEDISEISSEDAEVNQVQLNGLAAQLGRTEHNEKRYARSRIDESEILKEEDIRAIMHTESLMKTLSKLWQTIHEKRSVFFGCLVCVVNGAVTPAFSFALSKLLGVYFIGVPPATETTKWSLLVLALAVVDGVTAFLRFYLLERSSARWIDSLRSDIWLRVTKQPVSFFHENENSPDTLNQVVISDGEDMRTLLGRFTGNIVVAASMSFIGLISSIIFGWKLALVGCSIAPVVIVCTKYYTHICRKTEQKSKLFKDGFSSHMQELIHKLVTIRLFCLEDLLLVEYLKSAEQIRYIGKKRAVSIGFAFGLVESLLYLAQGCEPSIVC